MTGILGPLALLAAVILGDTVAGCRGSWLPRLAVAHLAGTALVAAVSVVLFQAGAQAVVLSQVLVILAATIAFLARRKREAPAAPQASAPLSKLEWVIAALMAVGLITAVARVMLLPLDWDGWAIWQLKAKAIADGSLRQQLTDPAYIWSHQDYPLLVPYHTVWLAGGFHEEAAQWGGFLFLLDLLALFYWAARERLPRLWALSGCAVILSWPLVMKHTASGFADLPLAAYALGAIYFLAQRNLRAGLPLLAGAVMTKNEGVFTLAAALLLTTWLAASAGKRDRPGWVRSMAVAVTGGAVFGAWALIRRRWGVPSDMIDPGYWQGNVLAELPHRLGVIARGFLSQALRVGPQYPGWGFAWLMAIPGLAQSVRKGLGVTAPYWLLAAVHCAGAAAAYLVTPLDPALHLDRSLDRLLLHIAPAVLLATLLALGPEESGASEAS